MAVKKVGDVEKLLTKQIQKLGNVYKKIVFIYPALIGSSVAKEKDVESVLRRFFARSVIKELFMYNFDQTVDEILKSINKNQKLKEEFFNLLEKLFLNSGNRKNSKNSEIDKKLEKLLNLYRGIGAANTTIPVINLLNSELSSSQELLKKLTDSVEKIIQKDPYYNQYEIESGVYIYKSVAFPVYVGTKKFQTDDDAIALLMLISLIVNRPIIDVQSVEYLEKLIDRGFLDELVIFLNSKRGAINYDELKKFTQKYIEDDSYSYYKKSDNNPSRNQEHLYKYIELMDSKIKNALNQLKLIMSEFIHSGTGLISKNFENDKPSQEEINGIVRNKIIEYLINYSFTRYEEFLKNSLKDFNLNTNFMIGVLIKIVSSPATRRLAESVEFKLPRDEQKLQKSLNSAFEIITNVTDYSVLALGNVLNNLTTDYFYHEMLESLYKKILISIGINPKEFSNANNILSISEPITGIKIGDLTNIANNIKNLSKTAARIISTDFEPFYFKLIKQYVSNIPSEYKKPVEKLLYNSLQTIFKKPDIVLSEPCYSFRNFFIEYLNLVSKYSGIKLNSGENSIRSLCSYYDKNILKLFSEIQGLVGQYEKELIKRLQNELLNRVLDARPVREELAKNPALISQIKNYVKTISEIEVKVFNTVIKFIILTIINLLLSRTLLTYIFLIQIPDLGDYFKSRYPDLKSEIENIFEKLNRDLKLNYVIIVDERILGFINNFYAKHLIDKFIECVGSSSEDPECEKIKEILGEDFETAPPDKKLDFSQKNKKYVLAVLNRIFKFASIITYNKDNGDVLYIMPFMNKPAKTKIDTIKQFLEEPLYSVFKK